jgi:AbrB family looped-hinge helix DNA binding protein
VAVSTITSKGQTTIPGEIRRLLKLKAGDRIEFVVEPDGKVVLVPATVPVGELEGLLAPAPRKVSVDEMDAAVRRRARSASARRAARQA